jgi:hypothetical protein
VVFAVDSVEEESIASHAVVARSGVTVGTVRILDPATAVATAVFIEAQTARPPRNLVEAAGIVRLVDEIAARANPAITATLA